MFFELVVVEENVAATSMFASVIVEYALEIVGRALAIAESASDSVGASENVVWSFVAVRASATADALAIAADASETAEDVSVTVGGASKIVVDASVTVADAAEIVEADWSVGRASVIVENEVATVACDAEIEWKDAAGTVRCDATATAASGAVTASAR